MNKGRILELADVIEAADRFDMRWFVAPADRPPEGVTMMWTIDHTSSVATDCGTVGCVAGWAISLFCELLHADSCDWMWLAGDVLELSERKARRLFLADEDSVWFEHAERYGLETIVWDGVADWAQITSGMAAQMLREIASGVVEL